jgi:hypothetical protein
MPAWRRLGVRLGFGEPGVQPVTDLVRAVGTPPPLGPGDHHSGGGHTREPCQSHYFPPAHVPRLATVPAMSITLDQAVYLTRTGDVWLFRGHKAADRAIQVATNSPVNHAGMSVVIDDLPPLMWHAELGRSLPDLWSGGRQRGVQLHDLRAAVLVWAARYGQRAWLRQLNRPVTREMEDAVLRSIARMDGTPFPSVARLASRWLSGRLPAVRRGAGQADLETAYCAEVLAVTYQAMDLLPPSRHRPNWYDAGRFWSGDDLSLSAGFALGGEISVHVPADEPAAPRRSAHR